MLSRRHIKNKNMIVSNLVDDQSGPWRPTHKAMGHCEPERKTPSVMGAVSTAKGSLCPLDACESDLEVLDGEGIQTVIYYEGTLKPSMGSDGVNEWLNWAWSSCILMSSSVLLPLYGLCATNTLAWHPGLFIIWLHCNHSLPPSPIILGDLSLKFLPL